MTISQLRRRVNVHKRRFATAPILTQYRFRQLI